MPMPAPAPAALGPATRLALLGAIGALAVAVRLFPVVLWGSVIHEYDPHFNYRVTRVLHAHGPRYLRSWFDDRAWYPLGRAVGETVYPGLMIAARGLHGLLEMALGAAIDLRHACVLVAPVVAALASWALFALTREVTGRDTTGLLAAALLALSPASISRSTAGSFDNEGVAIFLLVLTFGLWLACLRRGSMLVAALAALAYFAMVVSWGGYVLIINLVPLHVLALVLGGRFSPRLYVAYSTFYPLATLLSMQVPFVGFNAILQAESIASHAVFAGLQAVAFAHWLQSLIPAAAWTRLVRRIAIVAALGVAMGLVVAGARGRLPLFSGRSLTLLDPTYAAKHIPIIASVGEHQPPAWGSFYLSLGPMLLLAPLGVFYCFVRLSEADIFMLLYAALAFYFSGIMIRLLLTLAPVACFLSAVGAAEMIERIALMLGVNHRIHHQQDQEQQHHQDPPEATTIGGAPVHAHRRSPSSTSAAAAALAIQAQQRAQEELAAKMSFWGDVWRASIHRLRFLRRPRPSDSDHVAFPDAMGLMLVAVCLLLIIHARHSAAVARKAFSSTSMVIETWDPAAQRYAVHDDYREAYHWLRMNTPADARVLGWWDYGYQLSALANRTVLVDNNTWNTTHIATVGRVLASPEAAAWPILESLGVDYVLILFGGRLGMQGDDLDKLPWILRIAQGVFPDAVVESEFSVHGRTLVDRDNATVALRESLLYKMSYHGFHAIDDTDGDQNTSSPLAMDRNRRVAVDARGIGFRHLEEAFTTSSWAVRIYRVKHERRN